MKKSILVLALITMPLFVWCQRNNLLNDAGVIFGGGLSKICGGESWNTTTGFLLGAETNAYAFTTNSFLRTGIVFTLQGAAYTENYSTDFYTGVLKSSQQDEMEFSGKVSLSYIAVPVLYHYRTDRGFYLDAGIQPGVLVSAKDKPDDGSSYDYKDYIKTFDIGILGGIGYYISDGFSVGARAVLGVPNINTEGTEMYSSDDTDRNFVLMGVARIYLNMLE